LSRTCCADKTSTRTSSKSPPVAYVHALQHEEADIPGLVDLYAKIDRMRILSSAQVVDIAERFARKIVDTYSEPNKSFIELREMTDSNSVNLMREFSVACREELETLRTV
jgi:hypothetical protein